MERFGLKESTIHKIHEVFTRYPQVDRAVLYGSRAKGTNRHGSDIDLTLFGGEDLTRRELFRIMDDIDNLLLPYSFDLSIFRYITDKDVIEHIQRRGVTFYERPKQSTHPANGDSSLDKPGRIR